jgi:lysophospholipase L1-like esterase
MGHNDICQHDESQIPDESAFEGNARDALSNLSAGLPAGATIYVLGMADIIRLYEIAQDKKALGIVDCEFLWFFTLFDLFPCGTVLGPLRTDADRERMHERIAGGSDFEGFNPILRRLVDEFNRTDPQHYYYYTDAVFEYLYSESEISDLDCFHPSPEGQRALSKISWNDVDGPQF